MSAPNERWSMDYVSDALMDGTRLRSFNVVDDFAREWLAIEVDTSIPGLRATRVIERIAPTWPLPKFLICDNGPSSPGRPLTPGLTATAFASTSSGPASPSRTPTPRASTASSRTSA
jgi:putative transposase